MARPERDLALEIVGDRLPGTKRITLAGDKGCDTKDLVEECRWRNVTPHVAQNINENRVLVALSAIVAQWPKALI